MGRLYCRNFSCSEELPDGHRHLQRAVVLADNGVAPRSGLGANRDNAALGVARDLNHGVNPSKRTLPSRTMVAPSSTATSKSLLMPIDKCWRS